MQKWKGIDNGWQLIDITAWSVDCNSWEDEAFSRIGKVDFRGAVEIVPEHTSTQWPVRWAGPSTYLAVTYTSGNLRVYNHSSQHEMKTSTKGVGNRCARKLSMIGIRGHFNIGRITKYPNTSTSKDFKCSRYWAIVILLDSLSKW